MNSPSLSPGRQAYLLAVRRQKRQVRLWQPVLQWRKASAWPPPVPVLRCRLPSTGSMLLPAGNCLQYKSGFSFSSVILLQYICG